MRDLQHDASALRVHGVGDLLPRATCSAVSMPGVLAYETPVAAIWVISVTINPADARWV